MLIGLAGEIGSGKDEAGRLLQRIITPQEPGIRGITPPRFKIKKYADKLKEIVALLIGCDRWQLEDREFKDTILGSEWNQYKVKAKYNGYYPEFQPMFNDIYQNTYIDYHKAEELVNALIKNFPKKDKIIAYIETIQLTPRKLLQLLGTECGRNIIHENVWINALFADYREVSYTGPSVVHDMGNGTSIATCDLKIIPQSDWIITDVRFPNEAKAITDRGGVVWKVQRDICPSEIWLQRFGNLNLIDHDGWPIGNFKEDWVKPITFEEFKYRVEHSSWVSGSVHGIWKKHESETALDDYEFDATIPNNGTIEELAKTLAIEWEKRSK